jgi:nicotine blue oxidoreductase
MLRLIFIPASCRATGTPRVVPVAVPGVPQPEYVVPVSVAGLLLAAGAGRRMGGPKALLEYDGQLLVDRGAGLLRSGGCHPVYVVVGAAADEVVAKADLATAQVVRNDDWATGMASSLRAGLSAMPDSVSAVVVALADQPLIGAEAVRRLIRAHESGAGLAVATYDGSPRNPTLLGRDHWPGVLAAATGDVGARAYLRDRTDVEQVPCDDTGSPADLDTPADLTGPGG